MTREEETADKPWLRTREDYIKILEEGQTDSFSEWDNADAFFSLVSDGTAIYDPMKRSVWTSLYQGVWLKLNE